MRTENRAAGEAQAGDVLLLADAYALLEVVEVVAMPHTVSMKLRYLVNDVVCYHRFVKSDPMWYVIAELETGT